jgi:acyl-CoA hydrolase
MSKRLAYPVSNSLVQMSLLMNKSHANIYGNVHGGIILKMADEVAYVCAVKHCGKPCVTASVDRVDFYYPINIGNLVTFLASVNYVGKTSMEIGVKVLAEDLFKRTSVHTNTCYFTMVAIDENRKPTEVPDIIIENDEQKRRYEEAIHRRQQRLDTRFKKNSK